MKTAHTLTFRSCIGRLPQCAGPYWAHLVLSSMTQTKGTFEGSLFDTKDMAVSPVTSCESFLSLFDELIILWIASYPMFTSVWHII